MSWIKKITQQLFKGEEMSPSSPQPEMGLSQFHFSNSKEEQEGDALRTPSNDLPHNNIELRDKLLEVIVSHLRPHHFAPTPKKVSSVVLWLSPACDKQLIEALRSLASEEFYTELRVSLQNVGVGCASSFSFVTKESEEQPSDMPLLACGVRVEVKLIGEHQPSMKLIVRALSGYLWQEEYVLRPADNEGQPFFIGRCRQAKLPNGVVRTNHIAFIGEEESSDPRYKINSHVSRSTAIILYDSSKDAFCIARADAHGCSRLSLFIHRTHTDGMLQSIPLLVPRQYYQLRHGDTIVINKEVSLSIQLCADEAAR